MTSLLRHTATYTRAHLSVAGQRLREDRGELSWGQIIAGLILLTAMWIFQDQFADFFHYLVNTFFEALSEGDRGTGPSDDNPNLGDGDKRDSPYEPGETPKREGK